MYENLVLLMDNIVLYYYIECITTCVYFYLNLSLDAGRTINLLIADPNAKVCDIATICTSAHITT